MLPRKSGGTCVASSARVTPHYRVVLALIVLTAASASTWALRQEPAASADPKTFEVIARRFAFEPATIEVAPRGTKWNLEDMAPQNRTTLSNRLIVTRAGGAS